MCFAKSEKTGLIVAALLAVALAILIALCGGCVTDGNRTRHNPTPIICER